MLFGAFQPVQVPGEVAAKAGTTLIESGVLGSLLVVSVLLNVAAVWMVFRVMNLRVADTKEIAELSKKMVATFTQVDGTLASLNEANKGQASALQILTSTVNTILAYIISRQGYSLPSPQNHNNDQRPPGGE